jgi:hypothetical protein
MSAATYRAMRPQLMGEYENIVAEFRREGFGIYDDTADLHRAIACSDAYYGDASSLAALYAVTGKPVMIGNSKFVPDNKNKHALAITDFFDDGRYFWFAPYNFGALFRMDKYAWKAEIVSIFMSEAIDKYGLYRSIGYCDGKFYLAPLYADEMFVYDTKTGSTHEIRIHNLPSALFCAKFLHVVNHGKYLFFIPIMFDAIVRFNTGTGESEYYSDWLVPLRKMSVHNRPGYFGKYLVRNNKLMLPAINAPAVVIFDMDTCTSGISKVGDRNTGYSSICHDGENYWLAPRYTDSIVKWNATNGQYREFDNFDGEYNKIDIAYVSVEYHNGCVWCFPYHARNAIKVNVATDEISIADEFQAECDKAGASWDFLNNANYSDTKIIDDTIYAHTNKSNTFISYNTITGKRREERILFSDEQMKKIEPMLKKTFLDRSEYCKKKEDFLMEESLVFSLDSYMDHIAGYGDSKEARAAREKQEDLFKATISNAGGTAGSAIFSVISDYLKRGS